MTSVPINYFAVIAGMLASMVIGFLWYGPLFGKQWMQLIGMSEAQKKQIKAAGMGKSYGLMALGSLVMSFVLAHAFVFASTYTATVGVAAGLMVGFWNWLGFVAPVTLGSVLWENKSWKLWLLNNGYYLVTLCTIGVILAVF